MTIQEIYKFAQFSALAYVDWRDISMLDYREAIYDANAAKRIPGNNNDPAIDTPGEKIFAPVTDGGQGWQVADFHPNDAYRGRVCRIHFLKSVIATLQLPPGGNDILDGGAGNDTLVLFAIIRGIAA